MPALAVLVNGITGGVFSWLLLNTACWIPPQVRDFPAARRSAEVRSKLKVFCEGQQQLSGFYPFLRMASIVSSYLPGIPGGNFVPSLSVGAGFDRNLLYNLFDHTSLPMLIALAMVGYLAAVTQSPITASVIVMKMINGHALVTALIAR